MHFKINVVCDAIAKEVGRLERPRLHKMLTSLLTALLKQTPSKLNDALMVVKRECENCKQVCKILSCCAKTRQSIYATQPN